MTGMRERQEASGFPAFWFFSVQGVPPCSSGVSDPLAPSSDLRRPLSVAREDLPTTLISSRPFPAGLRGGGLPPLAAERTLREADCGTHVLEEGLR